ncbi:MAG: BREX-3 system phosphatase PglZ [Chloroflexi bacterium]|nr:BREX-3 system phosphatase PglZ [Chloroflexota bacterium]
MNWDKIVINFVSRRLDQRAGCCLLVDRDGLIRAEVRAGLTRLGWAVVAVGHDSLGLRRAYEDHCRSTFPAQPANALLLLPGDLPIPYDIERTLPSLSVGLTDIFPGLDTALLPGLSPEWYAAIFAARANGESITGLDGSATLAFVLAHCPDKPLPLHPTFVGYVLLLAGLVGQRQRLTDALRAALTAFFAPILGHTFRFPDLAVGEHFLSAVWQAYHQGLAGVEAVAAPIDPLVAEAAIRLDQEPGLQDAFTQLRMQGTLPAWRLPPRVQVAPWLRQDVHFYVERTEFLGHELIQIAGQLPSVSHPLADWANFARLWARMRLTFYETQPVAATVAAHFQTLQLQVEEGFLAWLLEYYPALLQRAYLPEPAAVHHLLPYLAATFPVAADSSLAILVVDGMGLDDWTAITDIWRRQDLTWRIDDRTLLALIPTLTSVSRQALLAGNLPQHFANSWTHTNQERTHWEKFWLAQGMPQEEICYLRNLTGDGSRTDHILHAALRGVQKIVGAFVINDIDSMIHSTPEAAQLLAQMRTWEERFAVVQRTVATLLYHFDRVVVTSDHGHVEGRGIGDIPLGQVAEERALRTRLFTRYQRDSLVSHEDVLRWPGWGLPSEQSVLLPLSLGLFAKKDTAGIGHGGASIEEVFVPFAVITRE